MELQLVRDIRDATYTAGTLSVNGVFDCFTLEPYLGDGGVGCAIRPGRYPVYMRWSNKFKTRLAHVDAVPDRSAIEIHDGNHVTDTEGCILVGADRLAPDVLGHSDTARVALQHQIGAAIANGEMVWLTVTNPPVAA